MARIEFKAGLKLPGGWVLERSLGRGPGTEVWAARRPGGPEGVFAVKVLRDRGRYARLCAQAAAMQRLVATERTARLVASHLFDEPPFFAFEPALEDTLARRLEGGRALEGRLALAMIRDVLRGLGEGHDRGVPHGGLTPANVLFDAQGRALVADFAGTFLASPEAARTAEGTESEALRAGAALGYAAPEVLRGGAPTPASDLYAAGVVLFHAATGALPATEGDRPSARRPGLPPTLDALYARLTAAAPEGRPASALEAAAEAEAALASLGERNR
jgi:serine/threonine protein kinase